MRKRNVILQCDPLLQLGDVDCDVVFLDGLLLGILVDHGKQLRFQLSNLVMGDGTDSSTFVLNSGHFPLPYWSSDTLRVGIGVL